MRKSSAGKQENGQPGAKYVIPSAYEEVPVAKSRRETRKQSFISGKSKEMANQIYKRKVLAMFPPAEYVEATQFRFIVRRFGVTKDRLVDKIAQLCAVDDDQFSCQKLKDIMIAAANDDGTDLSGKLHRAVMSAMANDRTTQTVALSRPDAFPVSPGAAKALRDKDTGPTVRVAFTPAARPNDRAEPAPRKATAPRRANRPPGYLPNFYDKVDRTTRTAR